MLSSRLVLLIEDHWEQIARRIIREIHDSPRLVHLKRLPELELHQRAQDIVRNLGHWLVASKEDELASYYEHLGRFRNQESIPLEVVVLAYLTVKAEMLEFVREMGMEKTPVELYAEEELEHAVGRFFDHVIYHLVRGYEEAQRSHAAVHAY